MQRGETVFCIVGGNGAGRPFKMVEGVYHQEGWDGDKGCWHEVVLGKKMYFMQIERVFSEHCDALHMFKILTGTDKDKQEEETPRKAKKMDARLVISNKEAKDAYLFSDRKNGVWVTKESTNDKRRMKREDARNMYTALVRNGFKRAPLKGEFV